MIPKKIHYCWIGGSPLPKSAKKCIASWKKYCPDYEIIEWNESNYDFTKNQYMREALEAKKWGFVPDFARKNTCGKTVSIVCFEIAPEYRGMGIASAFIDRVCADAGSNGYAAVEGYPILSDRRNDFDFQGPFCLYQKAGFTEVTRVKGQAVMRKVL